MFDGGGYRLLNYIRLPQVYGASHLFLEKLTKS